MSAPLLLDTQLLLWALAAPARLSREVRALLDRAAVYVSAASIGEIAAGVARGRLQAVPAEVLAAAEAAGFRLLPVTAEHAARLALVPPADGDPFGRLLIAQAGAERLTLLTNDARLAAAARGPAPARPRARAGRRAPRRPAASVGCEVILAPAAARRRGGG